MKKKRVLSFLLCFMFLFFVGCGAGEESDGGISTRSLDGVKVLSKPATYNFADAVGENASENYYNIFAYQVLNNLYGVYENQDSAVDLSIYQGLDTENGLTYTFEATDTNQYYLYDSIHYTIEKINSQGASQVIYLKANSGWKWSVASVDTIFEVNSQVTGNTDTWTIPFSDWTLLYTDGGFNIPSFANYYVGEKVDKKENVVDYYKSPYYNSVKGIEETADNYFQDALEYAVYMFVLGFDYQDENGNPTEDSAYFDFEVSSDGVVTVGGWGTNKISIVDALGKVKELYQTNGDIIGLTENNISQVQNFILDKVIGSGSPDKFTVRMETNGIEDSSKTLSFNRNYAQIVENIIKYACAQAPIGQTEDGEKVTLDQCYPTSKITDYSGNYFFMNYTSINEDGEEVDDDGNMFKLIAPAEYQSMILMPELVDVMNGEPLADVWLAFEYYDDPDGWFKDTSGKTYADDITIDIGFRFFDHSAQEYVTFKGGSITVPYGKYSEVSSTPDENWFYISDFESEADCYIDKEIKFEQSILHGRFRNNIGDGAINAMLNGVEEPGFGGSVKSILMDGKSSAKDFYVANKSASGSGTFFTLDYTKFLGDDGCDFVEVYFDIQKNSTTPNTNYNFKVGLVYVGYNQ